MTEPGGAEPPQSPLDNMAWHALHGPQADLGERSTNGLAVKYKRSISPLAATVRTDAEAWHGLAELAGPRGVIAIFRDEVAPAPDGFRELFREEITQYWADDLPPPPDLPIVAMTEADSADMVELTKLTEPGPFSAETHRTGRYFGMRQNGRLVAMAGERMRIDGWGEVSAVCVHPTALRQGLGAALTLAAAAEITARGDRVMLHVRDGNDAAHRLYLGLGFKVRRMITAGIFRCR